MDKEIVTINRKDYDDLVEDSRILNEARKLKHVKFAMYTDDFIGCNRKFIYVVEKDEAINMLLKTYEDKIKSLE